MRHSAPRTLRGDGWAGPLGARARFEETRAWVASVRQAVVSCSMLWLRLSLGTVDETRDVVIVERGLYVRDVEERDGVEHELCPRP